MKQLSPQKTAPGHSAVAHHTAIKGISHPAASTTGFPIQRKAAFDVEPDDSEKVPTEIAEQWKATVELALQSLVNSSPEMKELITEIQTDGLNVNFILANTNQTAKTAIGKTKNPEVPAVIDALATTPEGQLDVSHLTSAPKKELNIYIYKQKIDGAGMTLQTRYDLSHPQIHSTILHELLMHGHPHHEHIKLREELTDRPQTVENKIEELEKYSIPELFTSLNAIVEAKDHKLLSLWQKKGEAAKAYKDNDLVSSKEMVLHHVNDILEHISMDKFDDKTREKLVEELISISAEMDDTKIKAAITDTARLLHEEVLRSGTKYGVSMTEDRKSAIETLYSKFPSPEEKSPLTSNEESEESEEKLPQVKKKKLIPQPQTRSSLPFLPPPKNTPGGNSNPGPIPFSLDTFPSGKRSSLFDTLPQPQNTPTNRPSLFDTLPQPLNTPTNRPSL
ncbi:hypothetical protein, partial [Chitinophaga sp.]|uniref:hypothetical protein n=1 Tax=Chitinophaga sp. TaxID=1869181 RepID=UPI0031D1710C